MSLYINTDLINMPKSFKFVFYININKYNNVLIYTQKQLFKHFVWYNYVND